MDSNPTVIVCAFTVSNDSIRVDVLPNNRRKKVEKEIPHPKHLRRYPAVLIGRLGVNSEYKEQKIGSDLMDFIKSWFIDSNNKTGCRFLVVDSYNDQVPISYYQKNKFLFLFSTEELEAQNIGYSENRNLETRLMYFDLITLRG